MACKFEYKNNTYTKEGILDVIKSENIYVKGDVNKEAQWIKDKLGLSDHEISIVKGLIDNQAFGRFLQDGRILLSEDLEVGTAYHEVFHRVFNNYLTTSERIALQKEFYQRKDKDSVLANFKEKYPNLSINDLIEEILAEEFRDYVLSDGKFKFAEKEKQSLFRRFLNFLKSIVNKFTGDISTQSEIYAKIAKSGYKNADIKGYSKVSKDRKITYKGRKLDELQSQALMNGLMYHFTNKLLDNNLDFYNFLTNKITLEDLFIKDTYGEPILYQLLTDSQFSDIASEPYQLLMDMNDDGNFGPLLDEFKRYLNAYRIKLINSKDVVNEELSNDEEAKKEGKGENAEGSKSDLDLRASIEVDPYESVSNTIKLILATIPKTINGNFVRNDIGLIESEDPQKVYAILSQKLAGIPATNEAFKERLDELQGLYPYMDLIAQKVGLNANIANFDNSLESVNRLKLINDFIQAFAKTRNGYIITMINDDGNIYRSDAEIENSVKKIRNNWQVAFNQKNVNNLEAFKFALKNNFKDKLIGDDYRKFSELLGLDLPKTYLGQTKVKEALGVIFSSVRRNSDFSKDKYLALFTATKGNFEISGAVDKIANEIAENDEFTNLQHYNSEGKLVYGISLNTNFSIISDGINYIVNKAMKDDSISYDDKIAYIQLALEEKFPHLFTAYSKNSLVIKKLLSGANIVMNISDGVKDKSASTGTPTSDLSGPMRLIQVLNESVQGNFSFIQTGDRATVNSFNIVLDDKQELFYDPKLGMDSYLDSFIGYLKDEIETHKELSENTSPYKYVNDNNNKYGLRFFSTVFTKEEQSRLFNSTDLDNELLNPVYKTKIKDFLKKESIKYYEFLDKQGILQQYKNRIIGISADIYEKLGVDEAQDVVFTSFINQVMANIEQTKIYFGDLAAFKNSDDIFKRLSQFNSTRKVSINSKLNNEFVKMGNFFNKIKLSTGEILNYNSVRGDFNKFKEIVLIDSPTRETESITEQLSKIARKSLEKDGFKGKELDSLVDTYVSKYLGYEEGDGASWVNIYFYKEMMLKSGAWDSVSENIWRKVINNQDITTSEAIRLTMQKPNYVGPTEGNIFTATNRKTSYMPIIPQMVKGTVLEKIHEEMLKQGIEVLHLESAAKFGAKGKTGGKLLKFYNDGKIDSAEWGSIVNNLSWDYFGIQLDMNRESKEKITQATQATKNMLHNIFEGGIPRDYTGNNWEYDKKLWKSYGKDKKERLSKLATNAEEYNDLLNKLIESDIAKLKETIGYDNGKITKWDEFKKIILQEALNRNLSDNVLDSIELFIQNDKANKINTLSVKDKVEQLLMSVVTNRIIRQKRFGDVIPQGTSKALQKLDAKLEYDRENQAYYSSDILKFRDSKGRSEFAVPLPNELIDFVNGLEGNTFEEKLNRFNNDLDTYMPEELRIFHGLRIPNQSYASNTPGIIKQYLPPTINTIIVPSSFVVQTGSDFDIDKLFCYFKSFYVKDNQIKEVKFFSKKEAYENYVRKNASFAKIKQYLKEQGINIHQLAKDEAKYDYINKMLGKNAYEEGVEAYIEAISEGEVIDDSLKSFDEFDYSPRREALQNRLIDVSHNLLLDENNARQLYTATDDSYLKEDLLQEILEAKGYSKNKDGKYVTEDDKLSITDIFLPTTSFKKFKDFYGSKAGLGMVARHIPNHAITQIKNIRIAPQYRTWFKDNANSLAGLKEATGRYITDVLSAYLSGNVDAGKNPYLGKIGITKDTQDIATMLVRRGVSHKEVSFFLAQPVIQKYLEYRAINESDVIKKTGKVKLNKKTGENEGGLELKNADVAVKALEFFGLPIELQKDSSGNIITENYLANATQHALEDLKKGLSIYKDNFGLENTPKLTEAEKQYQFRILMEFLNYIAQTRKFNEFIDIANPDTNADKNISEALETIQENKIALKAADRFIENTNAWEEEDSFGGILKPYYEAQKIREAFKDVDLVYSNPLITMVIPRITKLLYPYSRKDNKKTREKITKTVTDDIILRFVMKNIKNTKPDILSTISGDNSVAKRIEVIKVDKTHPLHNNKFIDKLIPLVNNTKIGDKEYDNFQLYDKKMQAFTINLLTDEFLKIRTIDRTLFNDIIIANFLQGGLGNSPFQLNQIIPADVYYGAISRVLERFSVDMEDLNLFAKEYILNRTNLLQYGDEFDDWGNPPVYKLKDKDGNVIVHIKGEGSLTPKGNGYNVINYGTEKQTKINLFGESLEEQEVIEQPINKQIKAKIEVVSRYSNSEVKANPDKIYVFGDNTDRKGTGGQAAIRNNPNAFGIATKVHPTNNSDAFMSDKDLKSNKKVIDSDIQKILDQNKPLVFPKDGFGTGLAKLKEKAPQTYQYLKEQLLAKFGFNNDTGEIQEQPIVEETKDVSYLEVKEPSLEKTTNLGKPELEYLSTKNEYKQKLIDSGAINNQNKILNRKLFNQLSSEFKDKLNKQFGLNEISYVTGRGDFASFDDKAFMKVDDVRGYTKQNEANIKKEVKRVTIKPGTQLNMEFNPNDLANKIGEETQC